MTAPANINLDPDTASSVEIGANPALSGDAGFLTVAVFRIDKEKVRVPDPTLPAANLSPPVFNCYAQGEEYGDHIDDAIRPLARGRMRTDLSVTVFIDDPDDYYGGDLVVADLRVDQVVKLPAGDLFLYEASSIHHVAAVTRGRRRAALMWAQSLVRDGTRRDALHELDQTIQRLRGVEAAAAETLRLAALYHNLMRMWAEP